MGAGRPRNKVPTIKLGVRVPAPVWNPVKEFAGNHAEPTSGIVVEALQLYTRQIIENRCRICSAPNPEDLHWCSKCGAPLTDASLAEFWVQTRQEYNGYHRLQQEKEQWEKEQLNTAIIDQFDARIKDIGTKLVSEVISQLQSCDENQDLPPSAKPRPADEQTLDIDPSE